MSGFGKFVVALCLLLTVFVIVETLAPPAILDPVRDQGCYCHHQGIAVWVNGTDNYGEFDVDAGKIFTLTIRSEQVNVQGVVPAVMTWMPNMSDNAMFRFNPQEVAADSPQNLNATAGKMTVVFKITSPDEPGSYSISLSVQGTIIAIPVTVKPRPTPIGKPFVSITKVEAPSEVTVGGSVRLTATLRNMGVMPYRVYMYVTNYPSGQQILAKVYSEGPVAANGTITLSASFVMSNTTLSLRIHSGHVEDGTDIDDDLFSLSISQPHPMPPIHEPPLYVLVEEWGPLMPIIAAIVAFVHFVRRKVWTRRSP